MEWIVVLAAVVVVAAGIVALAGRAMRRRRHGRGNEATEDPHAATLAKVNAQAGPRIYDIGGGGADGGDGG
ncbi:MAG: hypothetical protein ACRDGD_06015 [Candidatus Limnocylindria bacterium]